MPKKNPQGSSKSSHVFMNHVVVNADQKPVRPAPRPPIIADDRYRMPKGIKFK